MNSPQVLFLYYYLGVIEDDYWGSLNMWLKKNEIPKRQFVKP